MVIECLGYRRPVLWVVFGMAVGLLGWGAGAWAQEPPRIDVEGTLRVTSLGEGVLEARYRYPGNLYHAMKQLYASNPYVLFRSLTGENQPRFYIDRKSLKIDFDDANRALRLSLTIPDLFRYTPDGWRMRLPELLEGCKVVSRESAQVIVSCTYIRGDALTAGQTVQYIETDTIVLPPGAEWIEFDPKEGNISYRRSLPLSVQSPGLLPWSLTIGTVVVALLAVGAWLVRLPKPAVAAEPVRPRAVPVPPGRAGLGPAPVQIAVAETPSVGPSGSSPESTASYGGETIALSAFMLVGIQGAVEGQSFPVPLTGVVIGRDPTSAQVVIPDPHVSRRQAQICRNAQGQFILVNLSQTNLTLVNGQPVTAEHVLRPGDRIQVAGNVLEVRA